MRSVVPCQARRVTGPSSSSLHSLFSWTRRAFSSRMSSPPAPAPATLGEAGTKDLPISFLDAKLAAAFDQALMAPGLFSVDQLMELAGLSVACAVQDQFDPRRLENSDVVVVCGPGNNGGDGLVAARHLCQFGFARVAVLCKDYVAAAATSGRAQDEMYMRLLHQARLSGVVVAHELSGEIEGLLRKNAIIVDAVFGFSFRSPVREPYASWMESVARAATDHGAAFRCVAVDVPSGWDVDSGAIPGQLFIPPTVLVSLTLPKVGVRAFAGPHYVGGRFVPRALAEKYSLVFPAYEGAAQLVRIDKGEA